MRIKQANVDEVPGAQKVPTKFHPLSFCFPVVIPSSKVPSQPPTLPHPRSSLSEGCLPPSGSPTLCRGPSHLPPAALGVTLVKAPWLPPPHHVCASGEPCLAQPQRHPLGTARSTGSWAGGGWHMGGGQLRRWGADPAWAAPHLREGSEGPADGSDSCLLILL